MTFPLNGLFNLRVVFNLIREVLWIRVPMDYVLNIPSPV